MAVEDEQGNQSPAISAFTRTPDGAVYHRYTIGADFAEDINRGIDPYSPVWAIEDLTPEGRGDWYPDHSYMPKH